MLKLKRYWPWKTSSSHLNCPMFHGKLEKNDQRLFPREQPLMIILTVDTAKPEWPIQPWGLLVIWKAFVSRFAFVRFSYFRLCISSIFSYFVVSNYLGFGLMDALQMVNFARKWKNVPKQMHCEVQKYLGSYIKYVSFWLIYNLLVIVIMPSYQLDAKRWKSYTGRTA